MTQSSDAPSCLIQVVKSAASGFIGLNLAITNSKDYLDQSYAGVMKDVTSECDAPKWCIRAITE